MDSGFLKIRYGIIERKRKAKAKTAYFIKAVELSLFLVF